MYSRLTFKHWPTVAWRCLLWHRSFHCQVSVFRRWKLASFGICSKLLASQVLYEGSKYVETTGPQPVRLVPTYGTMAGRLQTTFVQSWANDQWFPIFWTPQEETDWQVIGSSCWCEMSFHLLATDTLCQIILCQDTGLGAMVGQMLQY
jgi:hypothetical protein